MKIIDCFAQKKLPKIRCQVLAGKYFIFKIKQRRIERSKLKNMMKKMLRTKS